MLRTFAGTTGCASTTPNRLHLVGIAYARAIHARTCFLPVGQGENNCFDLFSPVEVTCSHRHFRLILTGSRTGVKAMLAFWNRKCRIVSADRIKRLIENPHERRRSRFGELSRTVVRLGADNCISSLTLFLTAYKVGYTRIKVVRHELGFRRKEWNRSEFGCYGSSSTSATKSDHLRLILFSSSCIRSGGW